MAGNDRFFPLFIDMKGKRVLIVGGGKVAQRRALALADFGADVTVIAPVVTEELASQTVSSPDTEGDAGAIRPRIRIMRRCYQEGDVNQNQPFLVIAATDERAVNHAVMREAHQQNILAIISDKREECSAYFPALAESDEYIAGLVSKTGNHRGVKEMIVQIRRQIRGQIRGRIEHA